MLTLRHLLFAAMLLGLCVADQIVADRPSDILSETSWGNTDDATLSQAQQTAEAGLTRGAPGPLTKRADSAYAYYWIAPAN